MINRAGLFPLAVVAALAITACGEGSADSSTAPEPSSTEAAPDTTDAVAETVPDTIAADDEADGGDEDGCDKAVMVEEIGSVVNADVRISGSGQVCNVIFADDSIGTLQAFSGSTADEAIDTLLPRFLADATDSANGVVLPDDRGYVLEGFAVVRGDSGQVFVFDAPSNLDVPDLQAAMVAIADLLLTR